VLREHNLKARKVSDDMAKAGRTDASLVNLFCRPHARAREGQAVVPLLRGRSPTRSVAPKPLSRVNLLCHPRARASFSLTRSAGAMRLGSDRAAWAVQRLLAAAATLSATGSASPRPDRTSWLGGTRVNLFCRPRARARGPGRGPAATGSLANEIGRAKTAEGSRACSRRLPLARGCRRIWRGVILVYWFWRRDAARGDSGRLGGAAAA